MINSIKKNLLSLSIALFIMSVFSYRIYQNYRESKLLNLDTKTTFAIIIEINDGGSVHGTASGTFIYKINNQSYNFTQSGDFTSLKERDTVLIKYSLIDPSVARVIEKNYEKSNKY
jgi:hypothetical protein